MRRVSRSSTTVSPPSARPIPHSTLSIRSPRRFPLLLPLYLSPQRSAAAARAGSTKRQPASQVHIEQTPDSAAARVRRHLPAADVPVLLARRFQIINLWRPIGGEAWDWPLRCATGAAPRPRTTSRPRCCGTRTASRRARHSACGSARGTGGGIYEGWSRRRGC